MFTPDTPNFQSLMLMLDAAHMGWWKADFQAGELHVSEYIAKLLGLDGDKVRIGQLTHLVREDYRMPIHNEFMALKVDSKFDRTFPIELPEGEVWLHAQLVGRQTDPATGTHLFRLHAARPRARPARSRNPDARKQLPHGRKGKQAYGRAARPPADRIFPHPAALRQRRTRHRLPFSLGQPRGAANRGDNGSQKKPGAIAAVSCTIRPTTEARL